MILVCGGEVLTGQIEKRSTGRPFVHRKKVLVFFSSAHENGRKNKCCIYIFVQCLVHKWFIEISVLN